MFNLKICLIITILFYVGGFCCSNSTDERVQTNNKLNLSVSTSSISGETTMNSPSSLLLSCSIADVLKTIAFIADYLNTANN